MPYNAIARQLADIIHCNACIINSKGTLLGYFMRYKTNNDRVEAFFDNKKLPEDYAKAASLVYDTEANLDVDHDLSIFPVETKSEFPDGLTTIAPIHVSGIRLGSLIIWRNDKEFDDDDLILVEIASTVVGIQNVELPTRGRREKYSSPYCSQYGCEHLVLFRIAGSFCYPW